MRLMTKFTSPRGVLIVSHPVCICKIDILSTIVKTIHLYSVTIKQELNTIVFQSLLVLLLSYLLFC